MTTVTVYAPGHYDMADSYGLIACQLVRHLTRHGVRVSAMGMGKTVMASQPEDVRAITEQPLVPSLGGIFLGYPTGYAKHANPLSHFGPRVCVTMFESSRIPSDWIAPLNEMDAVIVPSRFCADSFKACGVTTPIHVVPLGVGEVYRYAERPQGRPLTFLAFLDRGERKGGMVAYKAFYRAFGEDMDYQLILKARTRKNDKDVTVEAAEPNVKLIDRDMNEQELYELYLSADILINPHKGEGFGLIPREFAASGGLALTTPWSGTADDLGRWGMALPYHLEPARWPGHKRFEGLDLGLWATVDSERLAFTLRKVAGLWPWYMRLLPQKAQAARELYSWQTFAERVLEIWKGAAVGDRHRLQTIAA